MQNDAVPDSTVAKKEVSDSANKHFLRRRFIWHSSASARIKTGSFYRYDMVFYDFYLSAVSDDRAIEISGEENMIYSRVIIILLHYRKRLVILNFFLIK